MIKNKSYLWFAALFTAWSVDFLFWGKPVGVSYAVLMVVAIAAILFLAYKENSPPSKKSLWLAGLSLVFGILSFLRQ